MRNQDIKQLLFTFFISMIIGSILTLILKQYFLIAYFVILGICIIHFIYIKFIQYMVKNGSLYINLIYLHIVIEVVKRIDNKLKLKINFYFFPPSFFC